MKEANAFFKNQQNKMVSGMYTGCIGQIERYNPIENKADVVLLPDYELITDVPVSMPQTSDFFVRLPYTHGDYVFVAFSMRDIDGIMHEGDATPSMRMLDKNDAVVMNGINLFTDPLPAEDADKLVIGQKDGSAKMTMGDGIITFHGEVEFIGPTKLNGETSVNGTGLAPGGVEF